MRFSFGLTTRVRPEWPAFQGAFGISTVIFDRTPVPLTLDMTNTNLVFW
jgi:hypothetical protein